MEIKPLFDNRIDAGRQLAEALTDYQDDPKLIVLALPRGGIPVAHQVAESLDAPMDFFLVRKLGLPGHEELAMGAIASGGVCVLNESVVAQLDNPEEVIDEVVCAVTPQPFFGIGYWYEDFSQTTDEEVRQFLEEARE